VLPFQFNCGFLKAPIAILQLNMSSNFGVA